MNFKRNSLVYMPIVISKRETHRAIHVISSDDKSYPISYRYRTYILLLK